MECKFARDGCQETSEANKLKLHEDQCQFQPVHCPRFPCKKRTLPIAKIVAHMNHHHKININTESSFSDFAGTRFNAKKPIRPTHLTLDGDNFFFVTWRKESDQDHGRWFMWVYFIGFESGCEKYMFSIDLTTKKKVGAQGRKY